METAKERERGHEEVNRLYQYKKEQMDGQYKEIKG